MYKHVSAAMYIVIFIHAFYTCMMLVVLPISQDSNSKTCYRWDGASVMKPSCQVSVLKVVDAALQHQPLLPALTFLPIANTPVLNR